MQSLKGDIFNIQHFSTEDGPGIRTTVFFKGCPLRCLWCSNPESQLSRPQLANRQAKCVRCGSCIKACQNGAIKAEKGCVSIDRKLCSGCGSCVKACPAGAMFFYGETKSVDEVFKEIMKDAGYYRESGGGITCSGGECMLQADFVAALFEKCREEGIHTAVDTCGEFPTENIKLISGLTDLVLYDLKHMDNERHMEYTGAGNKRILANLNQFVDNGFNVTIRIPVIPGYNDSRENLTAAAEHIAALDKNLPVNLLPYHRFGMAKYRMLNMDYKLENVEKPSSGLMKEYAEIFTDRGLECTVC